jgi:hypothetical protein
MILRQILDVKNNRVIIDLPQAFVGSKQVVVTLDNEVDERESKILLMKQAAEDPLFLADVQEIEDDFSFPDAELKQ